MDMNDARLRLPESNVFRYLTPEPISIPDEARGTLVIHTASEIEAKRKRTKQNTP